MDVSPLIWWLTIGIASAVLLFDVLVIGRRPHEPSRRELIVALSVYIGLAIAFGIGVYVFAGHEFGTQFFAGWVTEYSLSVDNLFIFIIIMSKFAVPRQFQQKALLIGIILALIFRGIFIAVGAAAIENFSWVFYLFGAFLIYTAVKLAMEGGEDEDEYEEPAVVKFLERHIPLTSQWGDNAKMFIRENGKRIATPMFVVICALGTTDLLFALDSIPAIYGLTNEAYLVLTANIFALMGLRQLYFLIGGLLERLVYLSYGLAILLGFIGLKLVFHALHENELPFINGGEHVEWAPEVSIEVSLSVIVGILAITTILSLLKSRSMTEKERDDATGPRSM